MIVRVYELVVYPPVTPYPQTYELSRRANEKRYSIWWEEEASDLASQVNLLESQISKDNDNKFK